MPKKENKSEAKKVDVSVRPKLQKVSKTKYPDYTLKELNGMSHKHLRAKFNNIFDTSELPKHAFRRKSYIARQLYIYCKNQRAEQMEAAQKQYDKEMKQYEKKRA